MAALAGAATNENKATVSEDWETSAEGGAVYEFSNSKYLGAISNDAVVNAIEGDTYVTVAMWVYGKTSSLQCVFGYGDQGNGVKYQLNGTTMSATTKDIADIEGVTDSRMAANQWNFVAFTVVGKTKSKTQNG